MSDAVAFERCIAAGGVAVFPSDTVYGLACDPDNRAAVERLYALKGREPGKPSAVMFFSAQRAIAALPDLGDEVRRALTRLWPGAVGVVVENPLGRFPLACGDDPSSLGLRVPDAPWLAGVGRPVLQSSANLSGRSDPVTVGGIPESVRAGADLVLDGGRLPGRPSTLVDLRRYQNAGEWRVLRAGAVPEVEIAAALGSPFHFDPDTYLDEIREDIPVYDTLQDALVAASGTDARRILELGTGTGETARRLLARHPHATLVGIDVSQPMLDAARSSLPRARTQLRVQRLEDPLPPGPFDLVASALCVHHLEGDAKADLFGRVAAVLTPGGRFALADLVLVDDPAVARTAWTPGYDFPSPVDDQLRWLEEAGLRASVSWSQGDLALILAHPDR